MFFSLRQNIKTIIVSSLDMTFQFFSRIFTFLIKTKVVNESNGSCSIEKTDANEKIDVVNVDMNLNRTFT